MSAPGQMRNRNPRTAPFSQIVLERQRLEALRRAATDCLEDLESHLEMTRDCFRNAKGDYDTPEDQAYVNDMAGRLARLRRALCP